MNSLKSKKLIVALLAAVGMIVNDLYGSPVSTETIYSVLGLLGTYILGQSVADHGAQGAAKAAERAVGMGVDVAAAVQGALGARASGKQHVHDDGPGWDDTTEVDDEDDDGPKELNE